MCAGTTASRQGFSHTAVLIKASFQTHRLSVQAGDEDGWDEALSYMDACGPGWHLQIARTTSDDGLANESLKSLSNCMLSDSTRSVSKPMHAGAGLLLPCRQVSELTLQSVSAPCLCSAAHRCVKTGSVCG